MPNPNRPRTELTDVERIHLAHLVEDHAASFYGPAGAFTFTFGDAVRYTAEGYVEKVFTDVDRNTLWDLVRAELEARPEILQRGRLTDTQRADNARRRTDAAAVHDRTALDALRDGRWDDALAAIDLAEREAPLRSGIHNWESIRSHIRAARDAAEALTTEQAP